MNTVYYFKNIYGDYRFSNGIFRPDGEGAAQYLAQLREEGKEVERLYPDISEDRAKICEVFGYRSDTSWRELYYDLFE